MQVYTSNYFKYKGRRGVQISNSRPNGVYVNRAIPVLFPDWDMVEKWNTVKNLPDAENENVWHDFVSAYWNKLDSIGFDKISKLIQDGDVLLCWCNKNCHRHILATWLCLHGVEVKEW